MSDIINDTKSKMKKSIDNLSRELANINAGRANSNLLNGVKNCAVVDSFDACLLAEKVCEILKLPPKHRFTNGSEKITQLALDQEKVCSSIYEVYQSLLVQ